MDSELGSSILSNKWYTPRKITWRLLDNPYFFNTSSNGWFSIAMLVLRGVGVDVLYKKIVMTSPFVWWFGSKKGWSFFVKAAPFIMLGCLATQVACPKRPDNNSLLWPKIKPLRPTCTKKNTCVLLG